VSVSDPAPAPRGGVSAYARAHSVDVALRDGSTLHLRPVCVSDKPRIHKFLEGVSQRSLGFRFFGAPSLDWVTEWAVDVDYADRYALLAITDPEEEIVADGAYSRADDMHAEVAFLVSDAWQGRGIATLILAHLATVAERHGISVFTAEVLPNNHRMIEVFRESGFPVLVRALDGIIHVELSTSRCATAQESFARREQAASVAAVRCSLAAADRGAPPGSAAASA
jgi:acetate---CoA ligase (ADP-forming)